MRRSSGGSSGGSEVSFGQLLTDYLEAGYRPKGPNRRWTKREFAQAAETTDRTVRSWSSDDGFPSAKNLKGIVAALFGDNTAHGTYQAALEECWERTREAKGVRTTTSSRRESVAITAGDQAAISRLIADNKLFETSEAMDFWLYTAEGILPQFRAGLTRLAGDTTCRVRFLIQHPDFHAEDPATRTLHASVSAFSDVAIRAGKAIVSVRFYKTRPMLRMFSFQRKEKGRFGITGIYYHDPSSLGWSLVGADNNELILSDGRDSFATRFHERCLSRFDLTWDELRPATRAVIFGFEDGCVDAAPSAARFLSFPALLNDLRARGMLLAAVTRSGPAKQRDLLSDFDAIVDIQKKGTSRRSQNAYTRAALELGIGNEDCVVVAYSARSVAAAKSAGIACVAVLDGTFFGDSTAKAKGAAARVVDARSLRKLLMWVDSNEPMTEIFKWLSVN